MANTATTLSQVAGAAARGIVQRQDIQQEQQRLQEQQDLERSDRLASEATKQSNVQARLQLQREASQRDEEVLNLRKQKAELEVANREHQQNLLAQVNEARGNLNTARAYQQFIQEVPDIKMLSSPDLNEQQASDLNSKIGRLIATVQANGDNLTFTPDGIPIISVTGEDGQQMFLSPQQIAQFSQQSKMSIPGLLDELDLTGFDTRNIRAGLSPPTQERELFGFTKDAENLIKVFKDGSTQREALAVDEIASSSLKKELVEIDGEFFRAEVIDGKPALTPVQVQGDESAKKIEVPNKQSFLQKVLGLFGVGGGQNTSNIDQDIDDEL